MIEQKGDFTEHLVSRLNYELLSHLPQNASTTKMLITAQDIINTFISHVIVRIDESLQMENAHH